LGFLRYYQIILWDGHSAYYNYYFAAPPD
jgi:hypothetical protein